MELSLFEGLGVLNSSGYCFMQSFETCDIKGLKMNQTVMTSWIVHLPRNCGNDEREKMTLFLRVDQGSC